MPTTAVYNENDSKLSVTIAITNLVQIDYEFELSKVPANGQRQVIGKWNGKTSDTNEFLLPIPPSDEDAIAYLLSWACAASKASDVGAGSSFDCTIQVVQDASTLGAVKFTGNTKTSNAFESRMRLKNH